MVDVVPSKKRQHDTIEQDFIPMVLLYYNKTLFFLFFLNIIYLNIFAYLCIYYSIFLI
jgi:hypothetical protein